MTEPKTQSAPEVPPPPPPPVQRPVRSASQPPELPPLPPLPPLDPPPKPPLRAGPGDEPEPEPEPELPPPPAEPARQRSLWPAVFTLGFAVLAGAIGWLWETTRPPPDPTALLAPVEQQIKTLEDRVAQLEQRPVPTAEAPPDLSTINSRLSALEERPGGGSLRSLEARVARAEQAAKAAPTPDTNVAPRLDADEERLATLERSATQVSTAAQRVGRLARIQAAQVALEAGQPIGDVPNAPPELARFATAKPPTEASLHASFPAAAREAMAANPPPADTNAPPKPFLDRLLERAQGLVTVHTGDRLLVGDQTAATLNHARVALDSGDLENAVADVSSLKGPPADAMAPWLAQAKALLGARVALATLAANN